MDAANWAILKGKCRDCKRRHKYPFQKHTANASVEWFKSQHFHEEK